MISKPKALRLTILSLLAMFLTTATVAQQGPQLPPVETIPQIGELISERTTAAARAEFIVAEKDKIRRARLDGPPNPGTWPGAFWSAYMVGLDSEQRGALHTSLRSELTQLRDKPVDFQRAVLNACYTLLPGNHRGVLSSSLGAVSTPREFAMAAYAMLQGMPQQHLRNSIRDQMINKFPEWHDDPILTVLNDTLENLQEDVIAERPPLVDLLAHPFKPGVPVLFSLHRLDRTQPGIAVIRKANGEFHRTPEGTIFNVPHLAAAKTNLPGTITYGNSPRGIYTIRGMGRASNPFIGPTPYLWSKVPFEATVAEFLHDETVEPATAWKEDLYKSMLPASWADYFPMWEAWYAGRAGRSEMIIHGSTMDPEPFLGRAYYPLTPTAGCLSTIELWNPADGSLQYSDQLTLLRAFENAGGPNGYLVVVELNNDARAVTIIDIINDLLAAESRTVSRTVQSTE